MSCGCRLIKLPLCYTSKRQIVNKLINHHKMCEPSVPASAAVAYYYQYTVLRLAEHLKKETFLCKAEIKIMVNTYLLQGSISMKGTQSYPMQIE